RPRCSASLLYPRPETPALYTLSLHDALPICGFSLRGAEARQGGKLRDAGRQLLSRERGDDHSGVRDVLSRGVVEIGRGQPGVDAIELVQGVIRTVVTDETRERRGDPFRVVQLTQETVTRVGSRVGQTLRIHALLASA